MYTTKRVAGFFALVACVWSLQATATRIDFNPTVTNTNVGNSFSVDIRISGLSAFNPALALADFDLDISYDKSLLNASGVTFGPGLGAPAEVITDFNLLPGVVDLAAFSFLLYSELRVLQGDAFTLATLTFDALATTSGTSLGFVANDAFLVAVITDDIGIPVNLAACSSQEPCLDVGGARVVIGPRNAVPEPNPLLLFAVAALSLLVARRRHSLSR